MSIDNQTYQLIQEVRTMLENNGDEIESIKMSNYMKNMFKFAGIPKPKLKELMKPFILKTNKEKLNWELVFGLWELDYRESQYIALEYLTKHQKQFTSADILNFKELIIQKSWWETVDTIDAFVGSIVLKDESLKEIILEWSTSNNMWLRRVSIDMQQEYKEKTDIKLLEKVIVNNLGSTEFFINKAIGWSLRDYSEVNPAWVKNFVEKYNDRMAPLSTKEATRKII